MIGSRIHKQEIFIKENFGGKKLIAMRNLRRTSKISRNQGIQVLQEQYSFWEPTYSIGSELN